MTPAVLIAVAVLSAVPASAAESLVQKLLRIAGLTASPSQMRSPGEAEPGNVWIADLDRHTTKALTTDGKYRSPVFPRANNYLYALEGETIVRLALPSGSRAAATRVPGAIKLVGFDGQQPNEMVVLVEPSGAGSPLVSVSLKTGSITPLPHDPKSADEREMLALVRATDRTYGDIRVYTKTESKRGLSRNLEWTDVYIVRGSAAPLNVSACDGVNCSEPALSPDGQRVAFIKSAP
jgi:hypothetical protein